MNQKNGQNSLGLDNCFGDEANPIVLFKNWFSVAEKSEINDPNALSLATSTPSSQSFAPQPRTRERFFLSPHRPTKPRRKLCSPSSCSSLSVFSSTFGFSSEGRRGFSRGRQTAFADLSSSASRTGCLTCRPEV